ncbi:hypothetical protein KVR01_007448 [Diaporthe batatas]|uniref:uncharacterized protein n=1 Tax=Diaporthe batatas TaxID=748121 RepID=UPI001D0530CB|nr:uncharacterized protein KVR01_007448 [Diaporthe batatas]KAG8162970.1 hypothetical protein KVR01_007448 [Diaporthe batatas]
MNGFPYKPLSGPDEIRALILEPPSDHTACLSGSLKTIKLSNIELKPAAYGPVATRWSWWYTEEKTTQLKVATSKTGQQRLVETQVSVPGFSCQRGKYEKNEYDALSYTWDSEEKPHTIQVGKYTISIGANLNLALLRLRDEASIRVIWVDSICINQADVRERNHQVHMMKHIYSKAASVVVWLGPENAASQAAMDLILRYARYARCGLTITDSILDQTEKSLAGLSDIFLWSWWKRIWIVQEVVAARELIIFCGRYIVPWLRVQHLCAMIRKDEFSSREKARFLRSSGYQNFTTLDGFRRARGSMGLAKYLQCTKDYEATDTRDKLYALIGISCDISPDDIVPDYEKSTRTVFLDLVRFLVTRRRNLDIISSGRLSRPALMSSELQLEGPKSDIPSWLPDWHVSKGLRALDSEASQRYNAGEHLYPDSFGKTTPVFWDTIVAGRVVRRKQGPNYGSFATPAAMWNSGQGLPKGSAQYKDELQKFVAEAMFLPQMTMCYMDALTRAVMGRRFFVTKKNKMGLGGPEIQVNDRVVVVKGCSVPLIMRAVGYHMVIIGESYVSGIMDGEVIKGLASGQYKSRMIKLQQ